MRNQYSYIFLTGVAVVVAVGLFSKWPPDNLGFESYYLNWLTERDPSWLLGANAVDDVDKIANLIPRRLLLGNRSLRNLDLSGRYLKGINLKGYELTNVRMSGAQLDNANFSCTRLVNVDLNGASLESSSFDYKNCEGIDEAKDVTLKVNLQGAKLNKAFLQGPDSCDDAKKRRPTLTIEGNIAGASFLKAKLKCISLVNVSDAHVVASSPSLFNLAISDEVNFKDAALCNVNHSYSPIGLTPNDPTPDSVSPFISDELSLKDAALYSVNHSYSPIGLKPDDPSLASVNAFISGGLKFRDATLDNVWLRSGNFKFSDFQGAAIARPLKVVKHAFIDFSDLSEIKSDASNGEVDADSCDNGPCVVLDIPSYTSDSPLTLFAAKLRKNFFLLGSYSNALVSDGKMRIKVLCAPIDSFGERIPIRIRDKTGLFNLACNQTQRYELGRPTGGVQSQRSNGLPQG